LEEILLDEMINNTVALKYHYLGGVIDSQTSIVFLLTKSFGFIFSKS